MSNISYDGIAKELEKATEQIDALQKNLNSATAEIVKLKAALKKRKSNKKQDSQPMSTCEGMKGFVPI